MAATVTGAAYLFARVVFTWHDANPVLFVLLLAAEIFGMWRLHVETSLVGAHASAGTTSPPPQVIDPVADAIVIVTDEPTSEIRAAVLAARSCEGIGRIWIVDRDDRLEVTELARRLVIDRLPGKPDCDIGPLVNKAMRRSHSDHVVLIPADVVVLGNLVKSTVPLLTDSSIAVVTCQVELMNASKNIDHGGYGLDRYRDQVVGPSLDAADGLPWFPGLAVVRRQAVLQAGGIGCGRSGGTLDAGRRLRAEGWFTSRSGTVVGRQLAAWNDDRLLHRWARELQEGLTSARISRQQKSRGRGRSSRLERRVRSSYLVHALQPLQAAALIVVMFATIYTTSMPLTGELVPLAMLWIAWHTSSIVSRWVASRNIGFTPWITSDGRLMATNLIVAWRVLRKSNLETEMHDRAPGRSLRSAMAIVVQVALMATLVAFGIGLLRSAHSDSVSGAALGFALWMLVAWLQSMSGLKLRQVRRTFRTFEELRVIQIGSHMAVVGVSPSGVDLVSREPMTVGDKVELTFRLPQGEGTPVKFTTTFRVMRSSRSGRHFVAYLRFSHLGDEQFDQVIIYCSTMAGREHLNRSGDRFTEVAEFTPPAIGLPEQTQVVDMVAEEL